MYGQLGNWGIADADADLLEHLGIARLKVNLALLRLQPLPQRLQYVVSPATLPHGCRINLACEKRLAFLLPNSAAS